MKKTKKALASLAIAGMVLSMAPASVFAAPEYERLAGPDRYATSIAIAEKAYSSADTAVVAAGNPANLVDALAAAPLAAQEDAPIFLTDKADMNNDVVNSLNKLGVKDVIVVGAAASKAVQDELKAAGFAVEAVQGANRIETAEAINAKLVAPAGTIVVGYNGVADAMSIASYAAANNFAIVVANQNGTVASGTDADFILGGPTLVKDIAGAERIFGADRYETNAKVIAALDFEFAKVYVGNGLTLADALVGSVLAAQTNSPIALTDGKTVKADIASNLTDDSVVVALGGTGVVSNAVLNAVVNPPVDGEFKVESVSAVAANAFAVKFGKAPADASKVTFEVKRNSTPVTVTAKWDGAVATLTGAQNFPQGDYTVAVKEGEKNLGSYDVKIESQKIAKINITSTKLGVTSNGSIGYATYKVLDQYGNDITNGSLSNNIKFQTGVGTATGKDGLVTVNAHTNTNLITFSTVVMTAYDSTSGVSTSATLATSTQVGTISDIQLKSLKNADDKVLTAGDSTTLFYVEYAATDMSGNPTTNHDLISNGLITKNDDKETIQTSADNYVTAKIKEDPTDSSKAIIEVKATDTDVTVDMPIVITAMTWTGKTSSLNVTLKKAASVDTFTLMAPAHDIAIKESKEIPFEALDQNGVAVTKYDDFFDGSTEKVTFSGAELFERADGTAVLKNDSQNNDGPLVITATTNTGKYSTITINIQKAVEADKLAVDTGKLVGAMQVNAKQSIDTGVNYGGLTVKDQYGRTMNLQNFSSKYKIVAEASGSVSINGTNKEVAGNGYIEINSSGTAGSGTVKFQLVEIGKESVVIDQKSVNISVLKNDDVSSYTITSVADPIYTTTSGAITARDNAYAANPEIFGKTSGGAKVVLGSGTNIIGAYLSNNKDFQIDLVNSTLGEYDSVYVAAKELDNNRTSASTNLTVTIQDADSKVHTVSTAITSSDVAPVAKDIGISVGTHLNGLTVDGDVITISKTLATQFNGKYMARFTETGAKDRAPVVIYATDSYGTKALKMASYIVGDNNTSGFTVDNNGKINFGTVDKDDYVFITAVTDNGLAKTYKFVFAD